MLLPGENYSERLMFTMESYRETWVDGRAARLYGEAYAALNEASELSKRDQEKMRELKDKAGESEFSDLIEFGLEAYNLARKVGRFSKLAAPLILADGPLPFGDAVFIVALGLDVLVAAYTLVSDDD
tara:strand:- start:367 stop:747 length:381 start_codon:yes stop_codon:yes gene_type:complete